MKSAMKDSRSERPTVEVDLESPHQALLHLVTEGHLESGAAMQWMIHAYRYTQLAYAMVDLGIADELATGPLDIAEIARRTQVPEAGLARLLRGLAWCGTVAREGDDAESEAWSLTPLGRALVSSEEGSLADDALQTGSLLYPAWGKLAEGLRTERVPFELATGHQFFEQFSSDPAASERFDRVMNRVAVRTAEAVAATVDLTEARCIVDVGGGNGETLARLLARAPETRGVVFDRVRSEAGARSNLARHGCGQRCEFVAGDFFESVVSGGDVYVLQRILHDWDDSDCVKILSSVAQALEPGGRVLVLEELLGTEEPGPGDHAIAIDLAMLAVTGGQERNLAQYQALAEKAGLRLVSSEPTPHGAWILEFAE